MFVKAHKPLKARESRHLHHERGDSCEDQAALGACKGGKPLKSCLKKLVGHPLSREQSCLTQLVQLETKQFEAAIDYRKVYFGHI